MDIPSVKTGQQLYICIHIIFMPYRLCQYSIIDMQPLGNPEILCAPFSVCLGGLAVLVAGWWRGLVVLAGACGRVRGASCAVLVAFLPVILAADWWFRR